MAETFSRFPVAIDRGEGATLYDTEGKRYVDFGSGIAVNIFGANDEKWKAAVIGQLSRIQHVSNYYYSEPQLDLAELLCFRTGAKRVFFANSGAEANECALKAARKYSFEKYGEGRKKIISLNGSFHGRTLFTLTATGQEAFHRYFGPFVPEVVSVDANMKAVEKESENACAVIIECVQGESGVEALDKGFVRALRAFCDEHDILLICDEVQSGNGRTGKLYAYEHYGILPDIMTTAKGLGGGLPIGACLFFEKDGAHFKARRSRLHLRRQSRVLRGRRQHREPPHRGLPARSAGQERISACETQGLRRREARFRARAHDRAGSGKARQRNCKTVP